MNFGIGIYFFFKYDKNRLQYIMKYIFIIFDKKRNELKHNWNYKLWVVFFQPTFAENICPSIKKSQSMQAKLFQVNNDRFLP